MNTTSGESAGTFSRHGLAKYGLPFLGIAVLFLLLIAYQIYASRAAAIEAAVTNANNLALVLESKLNEEFAAAERTVAAMIAEIEPEAMRPATAERYRPRVNRWLKANVKYIPSASGLRYFDAKGDRLYSSIDGENPLNVNDRPHFQKTKRSPAGATVFSEVAVGRMTGRVSMYVDKPVRDGKGTFLGMASTAIDLTSLHEHFKNIVVGSKGVVALRRLDDGASVVRFPGPVVVDNKPTPNLPVRYAILDKSPVGAMNIRSRIDGTQRIYGYRKIGAFPLFIAVGLAQSDYLAEWRLNAALQLAGAVLFLAVLAAVSYRLAVVDARRDRSETRLREAERLLEEVEHLSKLGGWKYDCVTGSVIWTDEVYRIYGVEKDYDPSDPERNIQFYAPQDVKTITQAFWKAVNEGVPYSLELRIVRANGDEIWVRTTGTPLTENGEVVSVTGNIVDITERKNKEDEYRTIIQASTDGFWITDATGHILDVNESICRILGYSREELLRMSIADIEAEESVEEIEARTREMMRPGGVVFSARHRRKDRELIDVEVSVQFVKSLGERFFVFIRDIGERKQAERSHALMEARLRESQKMEALGTLAGGVAHDFNNIIASIMGNVDLARQDVGPEHAALESLDEIRKASSRAKDLVRQILAFGRRQKPMREVISLAPVVEESARLLRATLPAGITLTVECEPNAPFVLADATQVEQVVLNLCSNAWHAIQSHGGPGRIGVRLQAHEEVAGSRQVAGPGTISGELGPGRYASLSVQDNGSGMDEETMARIFEPFFTTKPVGKGTGLGLSVIHGIAKEHGASIEFRSAPGVGTTFFVYFPAVQVASSPVPGRDSVTLGKNAREMPILQKEGKRVLYVDDDESIVLLMTRLLERQGYRVSAYTDPHEALEAARADPGRFDLAVTDYNMPGMSGLELARALKAIRADLPVALASGYITDELREQAPAAGVSELIYKPNTVADLCEAVARLACTAGESSS